MPNSSPLSPPFCRLIPSFMKALQKMFKEHINPSTSETNPAVATELLILSLDLVKNRVGVLSTVSRIIEK